jgi:hypothetical protein
VQKNLSKCSALGCYHKVGLEKIERNTCPFLMPLIPNEIKMLWRKQETPLTSRVLVKYHSLNVAC